MIVYIETKGQHTLFFKMDIDQKSDIVRRPGINFSGTSVRRSKVTRSNNFVNLYGHLRSPYVIFHERDSPEVGHSRETIWETP